MKTGNRKCWHLVQASTGNIGLGNLTQNDAKRMANELDGGFVECMDGFKVVKCNGEAHSNAFIDHCMVCLGYHWGLNMVPVEGAVFWFSLLKEARDLLWNSKLDYKVIADDLREVASLATKCYRAGI